MTAVKNFFQKVTTKHLSGECFTFNALTKLYIPLLIDQLMVAVLNIINSAMVSSSGPEAVSAVNMIDSINQFMQNFFIAIATGGTVVVAQYIGRNEEKRAGEAAAQSVTACLVLAIVSSTLLIIFANPLLGALFGQAEPKVMSNGYIYLIGSCLSYPAFTVFQAVSGALRGMGDTRASMMLSVGMNVVIVIFNFIFINGFQLSVLGVSLSVNIARMAAGVFALIYLLRTRKDLGIRVKHFFQIHKSILKSIMLIGVPSGSEQMFFHGGKILTQTFIVSLGTMSMTAYAISMSILILFQVPGLAINYTVMTVVGQCMGAGNVKEAKKFIRSLIVTSAIISVVVAAVLLPFAPLLYQLYSPPEGIFDETMWCLIIGIIGTPVLWALAFVVPSALRSAGDAKFTSIASMTSMWLVRVMLGYLLGIVLNFGIIGVVAAMVLEWAVRSIVFVMREHGTKWYSHKVID